MVNYQRQNLNLAVLGNFPSPRLSMSKIAYFSYREREHRIINYSKVGDLIRNGLLAKDNLERLTYENRAKI